MKMLQYRWKTATWKDENDLHVVSFSQPRQLPPGSYVFSCDTLRFRLDVAVTGPNSASVEVFRDGGYYTCMPVFSHRDGDIVHEFGRAHGPLPLDT